MLRHIGTILYTITELAQDTIDTRKSASYFDLHMEFYNGWRIKTKLYDKRDDFSCPIGNFPFISSNIPAAPAYEFTFHNSYIILWFFAQYIDFLETAEQLMQKLPKQRLRLS
jgi:hypothetical protein